MKNKKTNRRNRQRLILYTRTLSSKVGIPPTYSTHTDTDTQDEGGLNIFCISRKITRKRKVVCWGFCPPSTSVTLLHLFLCQLNVSLFFLFLFFFFFIPFWRNSCTCAVGLFPRLSWSISKQQVLLLLGKSKPEENNELQRNTYPRAIPTTLASIQLSKALNETRNYAEYQRCCVQCQSSLLS